MKNFHNSRKTISLSVWMHCSWKHGQTAAEIWKSLRELETIKKDSYQELKKSLGRQKSDRRLKFSLFGIFNWHLTSVNNKTISVILFIWYRYIFFSRSATINRNGRQQIVMLEHSREGNHVYHHNDWFRWEMYFELTTLCHFWSPKGLGINSWGRLKQVSQLLRIELYFQKELKYSTTPRVIRSETINRLP